MILRRRTMPRFTLLFVLLLLILISSSPRGVYGFAAWFVDRRISCMTNLAVDEIIMNNAVLPYMSSREPSVHLEVSSLTSKEDWGPDSEHVVKFVIPPDVKSRGTLSDVQFVLEISGAKSYIPAKFTSAPTNGGGIGCEGYRSHGKATVSAKTDESAYAIFTITSDATMGAMIKIVGGWAIGHESVTLTESIIMFVGHGIATNDENDDDRLIDDQAEVELEEEYIEEERQELVGEIDNAEVDAVEALEEKREEISNQSEGSDIVNIAEEEIVAMLEVEREDVNHALDALKDEIESQKEEQKERNKELQKQHAIHSEKQRQESQRLHRIEHNRKNSKENKLQELRRRFDKDITASSNKDNSNNNSNNHDAFAQARRDKLDQVMDLRGALKDSVKKLNLMDKKEHDHAHEEHISPPTKERLNEMIMKVKQKMHIASEKLGVNELIHNNNNHAAGSMSERRMGGGDAGYHGDVGKPLHPLARIILQSIFGLVGLCGLVCYYLDKRRKAMKGRRNL